MLELYGNKETCWQERETVIAFCEEGGRVVRRNVEMLVTIRLWAVCVKSSFKTHREQMKRKPSSMIYRACEEFIGLRRKKFKSVLLHNILVSAIIQ
jgi:hypothetical protein